MTLVISLAYDTYSPLVHVHFMCLAFMRAYNALLILLNLEFTEMFLWYPSSREVYCDQETIDICKNKTKEKTKTKTKKKTILRKNTKNGYTKKGKKGNAERKKRDVATCGVFGSSGDWNSLRCYTHVGLFSLCEQGGQSGRMAYIFILVRVNINFTYPGL